MLHEWQTNIKYELYDSSMRKLWQLASRIQRGTKHALNWSRLQQLERSWNREMRGVPAWRHKRFLTPIGPNKRADECPYLGITWQSNNLREMMRLSCAWTMVGKINRAWFMTAAKYLFKIEFWFFDGIVLHLCIPMMENRAIWRLYTTSGFLIT